MFKESSVSLGFSLHFDFDCWLVEEPRRSEHGESISQGLVMQEMWRSRVEDGLDVFARRCGLIFFDFSPEHEVATLVRSPVFEDRVTGIHRVVELSNAFIFSLYCTFRERREDPGAFSVGQSDLFHGRNLAGGRNTALAALRYFTPIGHTLLSGRIPSDILDQALSTLQDLKSTVFEVNGAPDHRGQVAGVGLASLLNQAIAAYSEYDYALAVSAAWTVIEVCQNELWIRSTDAQAATRDQSDLRRRGRPRPTFYPAELVTQGLLEAGVIPSDLAERIDHARPARNHWIHTMERPVRERAVDGPRVAVELVALVASKHLPEPAMGIHVRSGPG